MNIQSNKSKLIHEQKIATIHLLVGALLMIVKISLGVIFGSKSLVVSAMFSTQNSLSAGITLIRNKIMEKSASQKHPFSLGKVEFVVTGGMSILVLLGVAGLCGTIAHSLLEHRQYPPGIMAIPVASFCALACFVVSYRIRGIASQIRSSPLKDLYLLSRFDGCACLAVVCSVVVARMGFVLIDSIVAIVEAAYIVWFATCILRDNVKGLLDASISPKKIAIIEASVRQIDGVFDVSSIKAVQSGQEIMMTIVVDLSGETNIALADKLRDRIEIAVRQRFHNIRRIFVGFKIRDEQNISIRASLEGKIGNVEVGAGNRES
ncbi:cation diffusion facilitator family transporter [Planctomycetota bacterium]